LLGIQLAGHPGDVGGQGIDDDSREQVLDERLAPCSSFRCVRAVNAVNELNNAGSGERRFLVAGDIDDALKRAWTLSPRRSAAMATLESRISPTRAR
jgi:hypothetical protein